MLSARSADWSARARRFREFGSGMDAALTGTIRDREYVNTPHGPKLRNKPSCGDVPEGGIRSRERAGSTLLSSRLAPSLARLPVGVAHAGVRFAWPLRISCSRKKRTLGSMP